MKHTIEQHYPFAEIEPKWQTRWAELGTNRWDWNSKRKKLYCLVMLPYPSGDKLHIGHWYNYGPTDTWARFLCGTDYILKRQGYNIAQGLDAVLYGNIPGGGMSRSASLSLNLILSILDANNIEETDQMKIVDTVATLTVEPGTLTYGCGSTCDNITVTIKVSCKN